MNAQRGPSGRSSIQRGADGRWHGFVSMGSDQSGRRVRRHVAGRTRREVADKVSALEQQRAGGLSPGVPPTVAEWMERWVAGRELAGRRPSTLRGYRTDLGHIIPALGRLRLDRVRATDIEDLWRAILAKGPGRTATVAHVRRTLRAAFQTAVDQGIIPRSPVRAAAAPPHRPVEVVPFHGDELRALLDATSTARHPARWLLALTFGLRQGEALGLCWDDLDEEAGSLVVRRSLGRVGWQHGCGSRRPCGRAARHCPLRSGGGLQVGPPKTALAVRSIPLPPQIVESLLAGRRAQAAERLVAGELWEQGPHGGWMFAQPNGRPMSPEQDRAAWKALLGRAGVRDARLHDARHTAATAMLVLGIDARTVMGLLGWSQLSLTQRYQHLVPELAADAAARIADSIWTTAG